MTLYTLFHNTQSCRSCGKTESWSSLCTTEPFGSGTRHLAVHGSVPDGVPIVTVPIISKTVPLCVACIPADAAQRGAEARALFEQARIRKSREAAAHHLPAAAPQARRTPTLEELA